MTTNDSLQQLEYEGAGVALEFALWSLDDQIRAVERIEGKSERAITLGVAIVALFSGALTFQLDVLTSAEAVVGLVAAGLVAACFIAAVWLFFRSYAAVNWFLGPESEGLLSVAGEHSEPRTRQWLSEQILASVEQNTSRLQTKAELATWLFRVVLLEAVAAGAGVATIAILVAAA